MTGFAATASVFTPLEEGATILPELGPAGWVALGLIAVGTVGVVGWQHWHAQSQAISQANDKAQDLSKADATTACPTCKGNPCAALAAGLPGSKYRGGAHAFTKGPVGDGLDSHHMPADSASPLPRDYGPAIQMDKSDHYQTASQSRSPNYLAYIGAQKSMIDSGNFMGAFAMDAADVRAKFGNKYDGAIAQSAAYAECLKRTGVVH